jgi:hypothetical protein
MARLRPIHVAQLQDVLTRIPDAQPVIDRIREGTISPADAAQICELLSARLMTDGFDAEWVPTTLGRTIEDLIDAFRPRGGESD